MALALTTGAARADRPTLRALPLRGAPPVIDGRVNDAAWGGAAASDRFVERKPRLRGAPPVQTRFRVVFDRHALYFLVECRDDHPDEIRGLTLTRDSFNVFRDDAISLKLDVERDGRTTLGFVTNPAGARMDYRGINESDFRVEFDSVWQVATTRDQKGWIAEFRLPWAALGIDPRSPPAEIGLNLSRDHPRRNATYDWALMPPPFSAISASLYGRMTGLDALAALAAGEPTAGSALPSGRLAVVPHLSGGFRHTPGDDGDRLEPVYNAGLDLSARLGGSWRAQVTVNTDFAQVDLDDQVINLDRFGLFLPEKRDFYLNDLEVFVFGTGRRSQLLHTRRIGLRSGQPVSTLAGVKLVGRPVEALRVGLLQVTTRPSDDEPWTSWLVARGLIELGHGSNLGVMLTHRQSMEAEGDRNIAVGLDGAWRAQNTPLLIEGFALLSFTGDGAGEAAAATGGTTVTGGGDKPAPGAQLRIAWRDELVRPSLRYAWYDGNLRTDLGFFRRVDVHEGEAGLTVEPRIGKAGLEKLTIAATGSVTASGDASELLDWATALSVALAWEDGFRLTAAGGYGSQTVGADFTVGDHTTISKGVYEGGHATVGFSTPSVWRVSAGVDGTWRQYFDGTLVSVVGSLTVRPTTLLRVEAGGGWDFATFDDDRPSFHSGIVNGRVSLGFTPDLGLSVFGGWSHLAELLQVQGRVRWSWLPGSDLFLVYQLDLDANDGRPMFQSLVLKATAHWP